MKSAAPIKTDLVLVGGGHSHVQVLKSFGMRPAPGVRVTLITKDLEAPYSGMLPGYVAGHYTHDDIHMDAMKLAGFAKARFIHGEAVGIDRAQKQILLRNRPPLAYDLLSLDIGIRPDTSGITGADEHAIPVKPVATFAARWDDVQRRALTQSGPRIITVIGGGAAGFELILAMAHRLRTLAAGASLDPKAFTFQLVCAPSLLPSHNARARSLAIQALTDRDVKLIVGHRVIAISDRSISLASGEQIASDATLLTTKAAPATWFAQCDLPCTPDGFLALRPTLQVTDDDDIFAAGDCATVLDHPRPKAGVFAVRQGPPLTDNLRKRAQGVAPSPFIPQTDFLTILALGDRSAIAARGPFAASGKWVWRWKDRIDRVFMEKFQILPDMNTGAAALDDMRCGGCAAKVGPKPLADALTRLGPAVANAQIADTRLEDASILDGGGPNLRIETVDYFRAFWNDPYVFGAVAANHAMNDIFAMGGTPTHTLAICTIPHGQSRAVTEDLFQLLSGARSRFDAEGATLAGGHSSEGPELGAGFFVSGSVAREKILRKSGLKPGDKLILTKPLGTGILFAAQMRGLARATDIAIAFQSMLRSNARVSQIFVEHGATALTDVTGFGLGGHTAEMLQASAVSAEIDFANLPLYPGVRDLANGGISSTLLPENRASPIAIEWTPGSDDASAAILFDPQTSGGLLAGIPPENLEACLAALHAGPAPEACLIGTVAPGPARLRVV
ncbi:MAG: selenide, water dikinase SelD [Hyphomicrobiaceae bacterium]